MVNSSPGTAAPMRRDQLLLQMSVSSLILDIALYSHVGLRGLCVHKETHPAVPDPVQLVLEHVH